MKYRKWAGILVLFALLSGLCVHGYCEHAKHTPEYALQQAGQALLEKDAGKLRQYVAVDAFLQSGYEDGSAEVSARVDELRARYPQDPFFWHETAFMQEYAANHRGYALRFIQQMLTDYLKDTAPAATSEAAPEAWLAREFSCVLLHSQAELGPLRVSGDKAQAGVMLRGDDSKYGRLADGLTLQLELMHQPEGHWRVMRIINAAELTVPVTDRAEAFWTMQGWQ